MSLKVIEKVFNVYPTEFSRTAYAWTIKLLFKIGIVTGWTAVIAVFVERYGITALPVLFLAQATLTISGMFLFSFIVDRYESRWLVAGCAFSAALLLFFSTVFYGQNVFFFPLVLAASGIFLPQISIFLSSYIEDFFSPAECSRTFPVIESAETTGGIIGGIILASQIPAFSGAGLMYIWIFFILAFLAALHLLHPRTTNFYNFLYEMKILPSSSRMNWNGISKSLKEIRKLPFLQILIAVVFTQWLTAYLLEFQYTKVVDGSLTASETSSHSEGLSHGLGQLHALFSASALVVQLLLTSRILGFLGTFGAFLFHSIVTLMSSVAMLTGFGFFTAVLAKNNFEVSGIVNKNAYEASYYAFKHGTQKSIREFFEGFVSPAGTIAGTVLLLAAGNFFTEKDSLLAINVMLVLLPAFALSISIYMRRFYTQMVSGNLFASDKKVANMHAIEILAQKGHGQAVDILIAALKSKKDTDISLKIISVLRKLGDPAAIPAIEEMVRSDDPSIAAGAINALSRFPGIGKNRATLTYTRQKLIEDLKDHFKAGKDVNVRSAILKALSRIDANATSFVLDVLKNSGPELQSLCIRHICSSGDPAAHHFIRPYLSAKDPFVRANAVAGTYNRTRDREVETALDSLLRSNGRDDMLAACSVLWVLKDKRIKETLRKCLRSADNELRLAAATGLMKNGQQEGFEILADLLLSENDLILAKARIMLHDLYTGQRKIVAETMRSRVLGKAGIHIGKKMEAERMFGLMGEKMLESLKKGYEALGAADEVDLMSAIMEFRSKENKDALLLTPDLATT